VRGALGEDESGAGGGPFGDVRGEVMGEVREEDLGGVEASGGTEGGLEDLVGSLNRARALSPRERRFLSLFSFASAGVVLLLLLLLSVVLSLLSVVCFLVANAMLRTLSVCHFKRAHASLLTNNEGVPYVALPSMHSEERREIAPGYNSMLTTRETSYRCCLKVANYL
jgi:hypothetical protein